MAELTVTAVYQEAAEGGYIGYVVEVPGANTQGETIDEVRENLVEAAQMILDSNAADANGSADVGSPKVKVERLTLRAA
jgi:predicted RNase H-like HicB family nuclease